MSGQQPQSCPGHHCDFLFYWHQCTRCGLGLISLPSFAKQKWILTANLQCRHSGHSGFCPSVSVLDRSAKDLAELNAAENSVVFYFLWTIRGVAKQATLENVSRALQKCIKFNDTAL